MKQTKLCGTTCRKAPTKIWAKIRALLLLACLGFSLGLSLCVSLEARGSNSATENTALIGKAEADIFNETGYPIVKTPITLSGIFSAHPLAIDMDNMPVVQRIKEMVATGV